MHFKSLKRLALCASLLLLAACGGGGGGGSDSGGSSGGSGGGAGDDNSDRIEMALPFFGADGSMAESNQFMTGQEIPPSLWQRYSIQGEYKRSLTLDDFNLSVSDGVVIENGNFVFPEAGVYSLFVYAANRADEDRVFTVDVHDQIQQPDGGWRYDLWFNVKSSTNAFVHQDDLNWEERLVLPQGHTFELSVYGDDLFYSPVAVTSSDLGINWELGDQPPKFNTVGMGQLEFTWADGTTKYLNVSVFGELETVRLDAGFEVDNTQVFISKIYNPYKVIGVSKNGVEVNLSPLYRSGNYSYLGENRPYKPKSSEWVDALDGDTVSLSVSGYIENSELNEGYFATYGLPEYLEQDLEVRLLNRFSIDQTHYFAKPGDLLQIKSSGYVGSTRFDLTEYAGYGFPRDTDLVDSKGRAQNKGHHPEYISSPPVEFSDGDLLIHLEVGDETPEGLQGRWQYLTTAETRFIGGYVANEYEEITDTMIKDIDDGRYLVRAGISNVDVTAQAEVLGGTPISGRSNIDEISARKLGTRSIGGGNVIFKNVDTGEETEVSPTNGEIDVQLPTGDYTVSSEVEIDNGDGTVTIALFNAPAVVEGAAIDLGTFTAADADLYNFKTQLLTKEYLFFGSTDQSIEYGNTTSSSPVKIRITNTTGQSVSGIQITLTEDNTNDIFHEFNHQTVFGGMNPGESKELGIQFKLKKPATNTQAKININMIDVDNNEWNDTVTFDVSNADPMTLEIAARQGQGVGGKANGYIVAPGNKLIKLGVNGTASATFTIADENPTGKYSLILSNTDASDESAYGIGVATSVNTTALETYSEGVLKGEPTDNDPATPTALSVGDDHHSYLLQNDVDYYEISVPVLP